MPLCNPSLGKYKYRCECRKDSTRDWTYNDFDNCRLFRERQDENKDVPLVCPRGYAGDYCLRTINIWSGIFFHLKECRKNFKDSHCFFLSCILDWSSWSECFPKCGNIRKRIKRRLCLGDFGCLGSMYSTEKCQPVQCYILKNSVKSPSNHLTKEKYIESGGYFILSMAEIICLIIFISLVVQIGITALQVRLFWRKESTTKTAYS